MKYLSLVWSGLARKPLQPLLIMIAMTCAAALAAFAAAMARVLPRSPETDLVVHGLGAGGFVLILLLILHAVSQSLRERSWEFAVLRVLGFSGPRLALLLFAEVMAPCVAGATCGVVLAQLLFLLTAHMVRAITPSLLPCSIVGADFAAAVTVALAATAWPAFAIARQNLAATLARGRT
jgi:hypothetical protein